MFGARRAHAAREEESGKKKAAEETRLWTKVKGTTRELLTITSPRPPQRTISKTDISKPIQSPGFVEYQHAPLIPLGVVDARPLLLSPISELVSSRPLTAVTAYTGLQSPSPTPLNSPTPTQRYFSGLPQVHTPVGLNRAQELGTEIKVGQHVARKDPTKRHGRILSRDTPPSTPPQTRFEEFASGLSFETPESLVEPADSLPTPATGGSKKRPRESDSFDSDRTLVPDDQLTQTTKRQHRKSFSTQVVGDIAEQVEAHKERQTLASAYVLREFHEVRHPRFMEAFRLQPPPAVGIKAKAIQQAQEFEEIVAEKSRRSGVESPPYDFIELIGKGSFGRVFKGKNRATHELVAIKIIDVDKFDYEGTTEENLQQTLREINILQQLKDSRARPYVNIIEEARNVHNELWVISEYASGGSVATLLKPNAQRLRTGLEEKYIIPIARELALGLKFIHEAGILHRDVKCGNVLVLEDGRVQLCDFGVSGAVESEKNKRSTIVGSVHWMPPELRREFTKENNGVESSLLYGSEIDIWAYGCTVFEMATGRPPFSDKNAEDAALVVEVPTLEGKGNFSETLNDLISFVCQPKADKRPTPDHILEHPYLVESSKIYPTMTLIQLVRQYYIWEHSGGSRISLFNGYGAPAPDPLAPQEDDEDDWSFSTSDEFDMQQRASMSFNDPFITAPPGDMSASVSSLNDSEDDEDDELGPRMKRLRKRFKEEAIERGGRRLHKIFDPESTPYRYSMVDSEAGVGPGGRPVSDLALRNEESPSGETVETVIDLDDAVAPIAPPQTMVGEVPTLRASRRLTRDDEEVRDYYDADQTIRRATRDFSDQPNRRTMDWKFEDQTNRRTMDWKFETQAPPPIPPTESTRRTMDWTFDDFQQESNLPPPPAAVPAVERTNRRTMEWTFDISMAEAAHDSHIKAPRLSRLREEPEFTLSALDPSHDQNRRTQDFVFPMRDPGPRDSLAASMAGVGLRPSLLQAIGERSFEDYPRVSSAPQSPLRTSMIDLDDANVDDYRPSTSHSTSTSILTAGTEQMNGNPFDLEDQVVLSQNNNRASYHTKSQSEPNHALPGLLTPQTFDEHGNPINQDPYHLGMHARGLSSVSQMQAKPPPNNIGYARQRPPQRPIWDSWSHQEAFKIDESPPDSTSTATSPEDDRSMDEMWAKLEQDQYGTQRRQMSTLRSRRTASQDEDPRSDAEDNYASESFDEQQPTRRSRISLGPNGRPLIDFPIPRGPDAEALAGVQTDPRALGDMLFKSALDMRNALGTSRALLGSFKPVESGPGVGMGMGMGMGTVVEGSER